MTASAINALIMGKRKLPSILRREVPPLHVTSDVRRLMGHSKVGKVIKHRGRPVIVLAVHENIRQVVFAFVADAQRFADGAPAAVTALPGQQQIK